MSATSCDEYVSNLSSNAYTTTGSYQEIIPNSNGCDSIITLDLTVHHRSFASLNYESCEEFTFPSTAQTITSSGVYQDTITNELGCDSVLTMNVVIHNSQVSSMTETSCLEYTSPSGLYTWTESGNYTDILSTQHGCDSIVNITLHLDSIRTDVSQSGITLRALQINAQYQWLDCGNFMAELPGEKAIELDAPYNGIFALAISSGTCVDTSDCYQVNSVGMESVSDEAEARLYPNPTAGELNIELSSTHDFDRLMVMDARGSVLIQESLSGEFSKVLDLSSLAEGAYIITLAGDAEILQKSVIVRH